MNIWSTRCNGYSDPDRPIGRVTPPTRCSDHPLQGGVTTPYRVEWPPTRRSDYPTGQSDPHYEAERPPTGLTATPTGQWPLWGWSYPPRGCSDPPRCHWAEARRSFNSASTVSLNSVRSSSSLPSRASRPRRVYSVTSATQPASSACNMQIFSLRIHGFRSWLYSACTLGQ